MPVECPNCGSRFLRPSRARSFAERLDFFKFVDHLRCLDCKTRFDAKTFTWSDIRYARCPICRRMDLNGWTGQNYVPPLIMGWKINLGARRYRCEYCRHNFASFRLRKEISALAGGRSGRSGWKKRRPEYNWIRARWKPTTDRFHPIPNRL